MALIMKDNGKMINMMVLVYLKIEMVIIMNVILWMVKKMVKVFNILKMEIFTTENLKMMQKTEKG